MPLRILQVLRAPVGGLFRHVADLTEELAARGHEVGIVADRVAASRRRRPGSRPWPRSPRSASTACRCPGSSGRPT